jgi:hypothetical protein
MNNYKGIFYKEETKKHYYEGGAHFKYKHLVRALEALKAKREEEEEIKHQSRNKSLDNYHENKVSTKNIISGLDNNNNINNINIFNSPKKDGRQDTYIEQLLSHDTIKLSKKRKYKLKEIKSENKNNPYALYSENNRYDEFNEKNENNENRPNLRNNSLDHQFLNERNNNYQNKILLTEERKPQFKLNLKIKPSINHRSQKNLDILPKIDPVYYNKLSHKNLLEYNSNSNMATNCTNNKNEFIDPNKKMEYEINKNLNLPDFHIFSLKKKLPQLNVQSSSTINIDKSRLLFDKNKLKFTINENRNDKEELSKPNNINSFNEYNDDDEEKDIIIRNINLKKNDYINLKLTDEDKEKTTKNDLYNKLFSKKGKKSHKKSLKKIAKMKEE